MRRWNPNMAPARTSRTTIGIDPRQPAPVMTRENRNAALAAFVIMAVFGGGFYLMPRLMLAIGDYSTIAAGLFGVLFVLAFFVVFWLRGRYRGRQ